jgi:hypothetical protein
MRAGGGGLEIRLSGLTDGRSKNPSSASMTRSSSENLVASVSVSASSESRSSVSWS